MRPTNLTTLSLQPTSLDGTSDVATFTIAVTDFDEYDVSAISDEDTAANTLAENASFLEPRS